MKQEGLAFFTDIQWPMVGLVIFVTAFMVLIVLQYMQYQKDTVKRIENLPFEGEGV